MIGPAHFPLLNPQHPLAHSASFAQAPVMNCVPAGFPLPLPGVGAAIGAIRAVVMVTKPVCVAGGGATSDMVTTRAALSFGCASPNPQPPSLS